MREGGGIGEVAVGEVFSFCERHGISVKDGHEHWEQARG